MLLRYFFIGLIISILAYIKAEHVQFGDKTIYAGLLSLIAVGLFGLIWRKQTGKNNLGEIATISIVMFLVSFFLADNTMIGFEKISAILLSFIAAGIFGLLAIEEKK